MAAESGDTTPETPNESWGSPQITPEMVRDFLNTKHQMAVEISPDFRDSEADSEFQAAFRSRVSTPPSLSPYEFFQTNQRLSRALLMLPYFQNTELSFAPLSNGQKNGFHGKLSVHPAADMTVGFTRSPLDTPSAQLAMNSWKRSASLLFRFNTFKFQNWPPRTPKGNEYYSLSYIFNCTRKFGPLVLPAFTVNATRNVEPLTSEVGVERWDYSVGAKGFAHGDGMHGYELGVRQDSYVDDKQSTPDKSVPFFSYSYHSDGGHLDRDTRVGPLQPEAPVPPPHVIKSNFQFFGWDSIALALRYDITWHIRHIINNRTLVYLSPFLKFHTKRVISEKPLPPHASLIPYPKDFQLSCPDLHIQTALSAGVGFNIPFSAKLALFIQPALLQTSPDSFALLHIHDDKRFDFAVGLKYGSQGWWSRSGLQFEAKFHIPSFLNNVNVQRDIRSPKWTFNFLSE